MATGQERWVSVEEMLKALGDILYFLKPVTLDIEEAETQRGIMVTALGKLTDALKAQAGLDIDVGESDHKNRTIRSPTGQLAWGDRVEGGTFGTKRVSC